MATYNWSSLVHGQNLSFNPSLDILHFDVQIQAGDVDVDYHSSSVSFSYQGKTVTVLADPDTLGVGNVTFQLGGVFVIGDGSTGTLNDDIANTITGSSGGDHLAGRGGDDYLEGGAGNDVLDGGAGVDTLVGGEGVDTLRGGGGDDIYVIDGTNDVIDESTSFAGGTVLPDLADLVISAVDYALGNTIEHLTLISSAVQGTGNSSSNIITGNSIDNILAGLGGSDTLKGGLGSDTLDGGGGGDSLVGGSGDDVFIVNSVNDVVIETSNDPGAASVPTALSTGGITDTINAAIDYSLEALSFVENLTLTGVAANATGNALGNDLLGNSGANNLSGLAGNDTLDGGAGNDTLNGGEGNDHLFYDAADGRIQGASGTDTLRIRGGGTVLDLTVEPDSQITKIERILLTGNGNNTLKTSLSDVLAISSTDVLRVDGNAGDAVQRGTGWVRGADQTIGTNTYRTYTQSTATLLVDTDITNTV